MTTMPMFDMGSLRSSRTMTTAKRYAKQIPVELTTPCGARYDCQFSCIETGEDVATYLLHEERPDLPTERVPQEVKQHHGETKSVVCKRVNQIGEVAVHRDRQAGIQLADVNRFRLMFLSD